MKKIKEILGTMTREEGLLWIGSAVCMAVMIAMIIMDAMRLSNN
jgi:hypothetical protein